jgi:hypothetical protein
MNRRDQELLQKQLQHVRPAPRNDGVMILALAAVFFAGIALGGFLFAHRTEPTLYASNDAAPAMPFPHLRPQILLR